MQPYVGKCLKGCGCRITNSRTVGSVLRSSNIQKNCAAIVPLITAVQWALKEKLYAY